MKLYRTSSVACVAAVLAVLAAGCGDDGGATAPTPTPTTLAPVTTAAPTTVPATQAPTTAAPTAAPTTTAPTPSTTAPAPTVPPGGEGVELLTAVNIVSADAPGDWIVTKPAHELVTSLYDLRAYSGDVDDCQGLEAVVPVPYETMVSAGRVELSSKTGSPGSIYLVVMADEAAAIEYMTFIRETPAFDDCLVGATSAFLQSQLPAGYEIQDEGPRAGDPIEGFGDDQVIISSELAVVQKGVELLTAGAAQRYSRLGRYIMVVNGNVVLDQLAGSVYTRVSNLAPVG